MDLLAQGLSQGQTALKLGISSESVRYAANWNNQYWLNQLGERIGEFKADILNKYARLFHEAIDAWERSKEQSGESKESYLERDSKMGPINMASIGAPNRFKQRTVTKKGPGDPRFLAEARGILHDIRKLTGVDAAKQVDLILPSGRNILTTFIKTLSTEELKVIDGTFERFDECAKQMAIADESGGDNEGDEGGSESGVDVAEERVTDVEGKPCGSGGGGGSGVGEKSVADKPADKEADKPAADKPANGKANGEAAGSGTIIDANGKPKRRRGRLRKSDGGGGGGSGSNGSGGSGGSNGSGSNGSGSNGNGDGKNPIGG